MNVKVGSDEDAASSVVASLLSNRSHIPQSATAALLSTISQPGSTESQDLLSSGAAARLCGFIIDAAEERISRGDGEEGTSTSTSTSTSSSSSSLLTALRLLRNLCASGERTGDAIAPTGVARAAAVLAAAAVGGGGEKGKEKGSEGGGGGSGEGGGGTASADAANANDPRVPIAAAQLLANLATCSASGAEAVWREIAGGGGGGVGGGGGGAGAAAPAASSASSFLVVAARQGGPRVAGPLASAADAALLRLARKFDESSPSSASAAAAASNDNDDNNENNAARLLCCSSSSSSPFLAAVVDGLRLESGTLHNEEEGDEEENDDDSKSKREKEAAATAVAARAVARLLRSLSFCFPRGLSLALEALVEGPPANKGRKESALRLLGHVVAEEGCFGGCGGGGEGLGVEIERDGNEDEDEEDGGKEKKVSSSPSSLALDSFASAILEALDSPTASPGEVEACLALLREVAARNDDEGEIGGGRERNDSSSPSSPRSSLSVVAALVKAGLVPRILERIASLPPVRGQEEAEAESQARKGGGGEEEGGGGEGEGEEEEREELASRRRRRRIHRRLPRYPEERADAVAVLSNALHRRRYVAESLLSCEGGAELLLAQCGAVGGEEAGEGEWRRREEKETTTTTTTENNKNGPSSLRPSRNPLPPTVGAFAREWALWGLRNLTEGSDEARKLLSDLRPVKAVPSEELERVGLRLELDEGSGKFELRKIE